nr:NINE protein [uncultured Albidiferax sp.]
MKNKTLAAWLAFVGGPIGLHRFYLHSLGDLWGWLYWIPTALGLYGIQRVQVAGVDDHWSWVLIPMLGFSIAASALTAIVYGLMAPEKWNAKFNPRHAADALPGQTNWFTVGALVCALLVGTGTLMASLAFSFQRYFEYQVELGQQLSQ